MPDSGVDTIRPAASRRAVLTAGARCVLLSPVLGSCAGAERDPNEGARRLPPRLETDVGQYTVLQPIREARPTPFLTESGGATDLGEFRGKVVLLNFWAPWCAPCVVEMPSLDRLAGDMRANDLAVVAVSIDDGGLAPAIAFRRRHDLKNLGVFADPNHLTAHMRGDRKDGEFALYGLPISYIIDRVGRTRGYVTGAVDWQSDEAQALIRHYLQEPAQEQP